MDSSEKFIREICNMADYKSIETKFGLHDDWIIHMAAEDDWSFVIKMHALLEAAANEALLGAIDKPEISESIAYLGFSDTKTGKVKLLETLGLLTKDARKFCWKFSELRNQFAHNIHNVEKSIEIFLATLSSSDANGFRNIFCWGQTDLPSISRKDDFSEDALTFAISAAYSWNTSAKLAIWFGCLYVLKLFGDHTASTKVS